jgi:hypothetical protein
MKKIFILFICLSYCIKILSQKHSINIYSNLASETPDTRIDFLRPSVQELFRSVFENYTKNNEYGVGLCYKYNLHSRLNLGFNTGYSYYSNDFKYPLNWKHFGLGRKDLLTRRHTRYNLLQVSPTINLSIIEYKEISFGLHFNYLISYLTSSLSDETNYNYDNRRFAREIYNGFFIKYNRFQFDFSYRTSHRKDRDDVVDNNGLEVDSYNPEKWRMVLTGAIWRF